MPKPVRSRVGEAVERELAAKIARTIKFEDIIEVRQRCPKCYKLTLTYDPETGKIFCTNCGFTQETKRVKAAQAEKE